MEVDGYLYQAQRDRLSGVVRGIIFGDKKGRFQDGDFIRTSSVTSFDGDFVTTADSTYRIIDWSAL